MQTLDELEALMNHALAEGALAAEVRLERASGARARREGGAKATLSPTHHERLTVRVWVDGGRVGVQHGAPSEAQQLVGQALASTYESAEDRFAGPAERFASAPSGLGIADRRYAHLTDADRLEVVNEVRRQVREDRRFDVGVIQYDDEQRWAGIVNSRGVRFEERSTTFRLDVDLLGADLHLHQPTASRSFASIATLPQGTTLLQRARALLQRGEVLPAGPVRVVLPPLPMYRVIDAIAPCFTHRQLSTGAVFLTADGGPALSDKLHIVDDGALPSGLHTRGADDRGVPSVPLTLLRDGRVGGRFLDPESARALGTRPTGHVRDGRLQPTNLVMREGTRSINALLSERGGLSFKIDDLYGLADALDYRTGAFELPVDGVVMQANEPIGAMRRVLLRGNLVDLLSQIVDVCGDTDRIGAVDAASIIAEGVELVVPDAPC